MRQYTILLTILVVSLTSVQAQQPLYIVNGEIRSEIRSISPELIEHIETLPADEQTIAHYGAGATHGVVVVTLRHDHEARFSQGSYNDYIASCVKWTVDDPTARVVVRYIITPTGDLVVDKVLESTDARLRRRVLKAISESPQWHPATKNGAPVESLGVLSVQLPKGKDMPQHPIIVIR